MKKVIWSILFVLTASAAAAQQPTPSTSTDRPTQAREGFWFNAGLGLGSAGCSDCDGVRFNGLSGGLALGGTISEKWLFGVGTNGFSRTIDGDTLSLGTLDARFRFYPKPTNGFFLTGGLGVGTAEYAGESEIGFGVILGLGYDARVGKNVSITPFWNGIGMTFDGVGVNFGQIGVGITIH